MGSAAVGCFLMRAQRLCAAIFVMFYVAATSIIHAAPEPKTKPTHSLGASSCTFIPFFFLPLHNVKPTSTSRAGSDPKSTEGRTGGCVSNLSNAFPGKRVMAGGDCPRWLSPRSFRAGSEIVCHTFFHSKAGRRGRRCESLRYRSPPPVDLAWEKVFTNQ